MGVGPGTLIWIFAEGATQGCMNLEAPGCLQIQAASRSLFPLSFLTPFPVLIQLNLFGATFKPQSHIQSSFCAFILLHL